jgi:hypothetical protein
MCVCVCVCARVSVRLRPHLVTVCVYARNSCNTLLGIRRWQVSYAHTYIMWYVLYVYNTAGHNIRIYIYAHIQGRAACLQTCAMCMPPRRSPRCRSSIYSLYW